ncbi:hypothetical protein D9757_006912 [Collybiopsis confluens]|uniref:Thioredoxin n=1 Tax=Collybiopsis confluens TaxID=2823264 RepID=A0A8H5HI78_9AGAR|nr:hypothetical protein D9757_006912 [Collybiopsis confluens]
MVQEINSLSQFQELINGDKPIVIDFWATWCGPCRVISPVFEKLSEKDDFKNALGFYKVDTDAQQDIAQECSIKAMPTFILFHKGNIVKQVVGAHPGKVTDLVGEAAGLA